MPVTKSQQPLQSLLTEVSLGKLKLPEIQRSYVWKPTQVARLVESLYRGYPTGSLLLWRTEDSPTAREMKIGESQPVASFPPVFLLDGQQRLTSLHRALRRDHHLDPRAFIEIVFNVLTEEFQNESAATKKDKRWVRVADVLAPDADVFEMAELCVGVAGEEERRTIQRRLNRLSQILNHDFHIETLSEFDYETVANIFVRVNSGGRTLKLTDLALATLSARWPGVVAKFERETDYWVTKGYPDLDETFLTRLLTGAVLKRGLSQWSHDKLINATDHALESSWELVKRGLRRLVPIMKDIGIEHSALIPSLNALVPFVMLLGGRSDAPLPADERNGIIYCFLVSTAVNRYGGSADTILSRDIPAALGDDPIPTLLAHMGYADRTLEVRADDLRGRTVSSPYFLLSYLASQHNRATDWWDNNRITFTRAEGQGVEYHHIHPRATLRDTYTRAEINEIANLAFISAKANRKISDRSPSQYFAELTPEQLRAHYVPTGENLETSEGYRTFLARRRELLADAITQLLAQYVPSCLRESSSDVHDPLSGASLQFDWFADGLSSPKLLMTATDGANTWRATADGEELLMCLQAAQDGLSSDLSLNGQTMPVRVESDEVAIELGPFRVFGTLQEWFDAMERERNEPLSPNQMPTANHGPWHGAIKDFPVISSE